MSLDGILLLDPIGKPLIIVQRKECNAALESYLIAFKKYRGCPPPIIDTGSVIVYSLAASIRLLIISHNRSKRQNVLLFLSFGKKLATLIEQHAVPVSFLEHMSGSVKEEERLVKALVESRECILNCTFIIWFSWVFSFPQELPVEILYGWKEYVAKETSLLKRMKKTLNRSSYLEPLDMPPIREARKTNTSMIVFSEGLHSVLWRPRGLTYARNEIFLDVCEEVNNICSSSGEDSTQVLGWIRIHSFLSGMPQCRMIINSKLTNRQETVAHSGKPDADLKGIPGTLGLSSEAVVLDDVHYHECVDLKQVEELDCIPFVPPDGTFTLFRYRNSQVRPPFRVDGKAYLKNEATEGELELKITSNYSKKGMLIEWKAERLVVTITLPEKPYQVEENKSSSTTGKWKWSRDQSMITWEMRKAISGKEYGLSLKMTFQSVLLNKGRNTRSIVNVCYSMPDETITGLGVLSLLINEKEFDYSAAKFIKYETKTSHHEKRLEWDTSSSSAVTTTKSSRIFGLSA
eukprot:jgi/Galph1/577/GphlegSOOS_G5364.1